MDKINIEVIGTELLEAGVKIGLNLLGSVRVVPELGDKEEVFSWNAGGLDTLGNLQWKLATGHFPVCAG